jgi:hypothetical protein
VLQEKRVVTLSTPRANPDSPVTHSRHMIN